MVLPSAVDASERAVTVSAQGGGAASASQVFSSMPRRLVDRDFQPNLVAGIEVCGLCLHVQEMGTIRRFPVPEGPTRELDSYEALMRSYRLILGMDTSPVMSAELAEVLRSSVR